MRSYEMSFECIIATREIWTTKEPTVGYAACVIISIE
jgi:hypothetical protein